jgi:hypothetical protein
MRASAWRKRFAGVQDIQSVGAGVMGFVNQGELLEGIY